MGETRGYHSIDIPAINSGDESSEACIFKVPTTLRTHNPKCFTPNSFSFGPFHLTLEHRKETEEIKTYYLANLLSRKPTPRSTQEEFKKSILEVEGRARKCYAFPTDHLNKDEFVDMLVRDGCFIIEFLRKISQYTPKYTNDPVFSVSWILRDLYHDLILQENQIPWFVLECLFEMTSETISRTKSLTELALYFVGNIFSPQPLPIIEGNHKINHMLDLLRKVLGSSLETEQQSSGDWQQIPTATSLKESGIKFKKGNSSDLLDIKFEFKHGVLEIPSLFIHQSTCEAFRNLISYEQCYPNCESKITSYAILLNNLINTAEDIKVLREAGVVNNWLNPNDMLEFFKNIYSDTCVKKFYYVKIYQQVNEYTNRFWPKARAAYVRNHFADPWVIVSEIVAGIVVILASLQAYCAVMEYRKDSSHSPPPPP